MKYYPVFLNLKGKKVVVVGGGNVAERKARSLAACGARIKLISPEATERLKKLSRTRRIKYIKRSFRPRDLDGVFLAVAATDERPLNRRVANEAARRNILVNVVDTPALCNFIVPSVVSRGGLLLAISTGGASPALAKKIRKDIEEGFGSHYAKFLKWMRAARRDILKKVKPRNERKRIFERLVRSDALDLLKKGQFRKAQVRFEGLLRALIKKA